MNCIEYGYYDFASNENETKEIIGQAIQYHPDIIFTLPYYSKSIKSLIKDGPTKIGTTIDYPFGLSDIKNRNMAVESAIKNGISVLEMIAPVNLLCNRKYDKIRDDINSNKELCDRAGVELRYTLDYRVFTLDLLYKIAQMLVGHNIITIYPSSNYFLDNLSDNILASALINKKVANINIIVNGNAWTDHHVHMLLSHTQIYGYKTNNLYILELLSNKIKQINLKT